MIKYTDEILDYIERNDGTSLTDCTIKGSDMALFGMEIKNPIKFERCTFEIQISLLDVKFTNEVVFSDVTFRKDVNFQGSRFHKGTYFIKTKFFGDANFCDTVFAKTADFQECIFSLTEGESTAQNIFHETAFNGARFIKTADFSGCYFDRVTFINTKFDYNAILSGITFIRDSSFIDTIFTEAVEFQQSMFRKKVIFVSAKFNSDVDFRGTQFTGGVDFAGAVFKTMPIVDESAIPDPTRAKMFRSLAQACMDSHLDKDAAMLFEKSGKSAEKINDFENAIAGYRLAEKAYDLIKDSQKAGEMYVKAMDFKRHNMTKTKSLEWIWLSIQKYTSNYGESISRFIVWIFAIIVFFALVYIPYSEKNLLFRLLLLLSFLIMTLVAFYVEKLEKLENTFISASFAVIATIPLSFIVKIAECNVFDNSIIIGSVMRFYDIIRGFYFSMAIFATFGFGDVAPLNNPAAIVICIEVLSGYVMFGMLLTMLARRVMR